MTIGESYYDKEKDIQVPLETMLTEQLEWGSEMLIDYIIQIEH